MGEDNYGGKGYRLNRAKRPDEGIRKKNLFGINNFGERFALCVKRG